MSETFLSAAAQRQQDAVIVPQWARSLGFEEGFIAPDGITVLEDSDKKQAALLANKQKLEDQAAFSTLCSDLQA